MSVSTLLIKLDSRGKRMSQVKCPKCGAEIVPCAVGFPHEKVFVTVCTNCVELKLSNQMKALKAF